MAGDLGVVLVGAGRAGLVHGRNLADGVRGARLVGVSDPDAAARESARSELEVDLAFADAFDAVDHAEVDAIVLASPTFAHADVAIAAMKAGVHVLCEKPLASSLEQADAIRDAVRASEAVFLMAFMRRFDQGFLRAADRLAAGEIGEPLFVRSTGRGPGLPPEWVWDIDRSGGMFNEVNAHDLDAIRWFTGQEYQRIYALGRAAKHPEIKETHPGFADLVAATFEMDGGAIGQVDGACPADYGYDARVEIYGSEGLLLLGDTRANHTLLVRRDRGVVADPVQSWRTLFAEAYRAEDQHLAAVAHGWEEPRTSIDDGVAALEAAIAINRSVESGEPVDVATVRD